MKSKKAASSDGYTAFNNVKLIWGGKQYFDQLLQLINDAKESIHIQTYIYDDDETSHMVANVLKGISTRKKI